MSWENLHRIPAGIPEALEIITAIDASLEQGWSRPNPSLAAALHGLAEATANTPIAPGVSDAVDQVLNRSATEHHLLTLALARVAILGATYDALRHHLDESLEFQRIPHPVSPASASQEPALAAAHSWLVTIARAGWRGLTPGIVSEAHPVIAALHESSHRRLGSLLAGWVTELDAMTLGKQLAIPLRRWADLWSRAALLTYTPEGDTTVRPVSGRALPIGVEVAEHATSVSATIHVIIEPDDAPAQWAKVQVSAAKPIAVTGAGIWKLLTPACLMLKAAAQQHAMTITQMPLTTAGDLIWDDACAAPGEPADPFDTARLWWRTAARPTPDPLDRHPALLAEPVLLEGFRLDDTVADVAGLSLPIDLQRLPQASPLTAQTVRSATTCLGLLRWDAGQFVLQPLAVQSVIKRRQTAIHSSAWAAGTTEKPGAAADKAADLAIATLLERAGKLLRS